MLEWGKAKFCFTLLIARCQSVAGHASLARKIQQLLNLDVALAYNANVDSFAFEAATGHGLKYQVGDRATPHLPDATPVIRSVFPLGKHAMLVTSPLRHCSVACSARCSMTEPNNERWYG